MSTPPLVLPPPQSPRNDRASDTLASYTRSYRQYLRSLRCPRILRSQGWTVRDVYQRLLAARISRTSPPLRVGCFEDRLLPTATIMHPHMGRPAPGRTQVRAPVRRVVQVQVRVVRMVHRRHCRCLPANAAAAPTPPSSPACAACCARRPRPRSRSARRSRSRSVWTWAR